MRTKHSVICRNQAPKNSVLLKSSPSASWSHRVSLADPLKSHLLLGMCLSLGFMKQILRQDFSASSYFRGRFGETPTREWGSKNEERQAVRVHVIPQGVPWVSAPKGQGSWGGDPPTPLSLVKVHHMGTASHRQRQVLAGGNQAGREQMLRRCGWGTQDPPVSPLIGALLTPT